MKMVTFSNAETEVICGALVDGEIDFPTECLADNTFPVEVLSKIRRVELKSLQAALIPSTSPLL